jgi:uncharacterized protein (DUF1697 family)
MRYPDPIVVVALALIRGINIGGRHKLAMTTLRGLCEGLGAAAVRTCLHSGNVVFRISPPNLQPFGRRLETAIEEAAGFRPLVIVRTAPELAAAAAACPFAGRPDIDPAKLAVIFLAGEPGTAARARLAGLSCDSEEIRPGRRELYVYFRNGMGRPTVTAARMERAAGHPGTGRNWNTVQKLLQLAGETV